MYKASMLGSLFMVQIKWRGRSRWKLEVVTLQPFSDRNFPVTKKNVMFIGNRSHADAGGEARNYPSTGSAVLLPINVDKSSEANGLGDMVLLPNDEIVRRLLHCLSPEFGKIKSQESKRKKLTRER
ncbi:hypothetical protein CCACVL1_28768 [Corchorus capsularis]|uniref:Uncharacterized protein n=1 Tax=Corchorus capsularis TaxID=210143 RepID=A0A1R3G597_COCAP|nr:hypothetical protein CCACVL1_28768 [Corchorus capsularis]